MSKKATSVFVGLLSLALVDCGGDSGSNASDAFPSGFAVASLTAGDSSSAVTLGTAVSAAALTPGDAYAEKLAVIDAVIAAASDSDCEVTLPNIEDSDDPTCYGPGLDYKNHPDASSSSLAAGSLPVLDLGIWSETEGTTTEACGAAKMNALVSTTAGRSDFVLLLGASMVCLMERSGTSLPASVGDVETLTTELDDAVSVNNASTTITLAQMERTADVTDTDGTVLASYEVSITGTTTAGGKSVTFTSTIKHLPTSSSTSYKGRLYAQFDGIPSPSDIYAYSIAYSRASSDLAYDMFSALFESTATSIFASTGALDVAGDWREKIARAITNIDVTTGDGSMSYSWQAGRNDSSARIFNADVSSTDACSFFGYGGAYGTSGGTASDNVIDEFICNWAGPSGRASDLSASGETGKAQKQCMTYNSSTEVYEVDSSKNNITYAPTLSCDCTSSFEYKLTTESSYTAAAITNDLVTLSSDSDFAAYSAPTTPDLPSGF